MEKRCLTDILNFINQDHQYKDEIFERNFLGAIKKDWRLHEKIMLNPIWFGLKVTGKCNFKCEHCWATLEEKHRDLCEIIDAIDKLKKLSVKHITLSGGEPFLRDDIFDIISYIKKEGFHLSIYTNGSLLDEDIIKKLKKYLGNLDYIQISLDGSNDQIFRKQRGSNLFTKIISNINLLKDNAIITRVNMVATPFNVKDILNTYSICNKLKVDTFSVGHVYNLNKGEGLYSLTDTDMYMQQVIKCIRYSSKANCQLKVFMPIEFFAENAEEVEGVGREPIKDPNLFLYRFTNTKGDIYPDVTFVSVK